MATKNNARPNILLLIAHDLGQYLGSYGIETVHTPNLDRLARQGVRFANSFCVAPQCSPSRAALFTGRYPHSNGVLGLTHGLFQWDLHRAEKHLAGLLQGAGYHTALAHIQHETNRPHEMGFDTIDDVTEQLDASTLNLPPETQSAQRAAAKTCEYLRARRNEPEPFYIQAGFGEPHRAPRSENQFGPMAVDNEQGVTIPPYLVDDDGSRAEFAAFQGAIRKLDEAIGEILDTLDECGQSENTIVVFTTDHGIPFPRAKCSLYDAGLETCLLLRWPQGRWGGGKVYEELISHIDILPTLCEAGSVEVPTTVQGRSFAPLLNGADYQARTEIFGEMTYHDYYDPIRCIRTERWKLIVNFCYNTGFMNPSQQYRPRTITVHPVAPHLSRHPLVELYDLAGDPLEHNNLADVPEHASVRGELLQRLSAWMNETSDPLLLGVPPSPMHLQAVELLQGERAAK